ncbi:MULTISPECIES: outer membrane protein [Tabrizicola]|uniref:outer membrane protein n=1 Tax=Tabrizicola TaxID=1443919 RepID=UPI001436C0E7|nr:MULTISPECIES: outer membrane beta-barrel protein [Paracoccaceae]
MMNTRSLAIACLVLAAGPASAGGPVVVASEPVVAAPVAPAAPSYDWTGFYAGLALTMGSIDDGTISYDTQGFGVQAGYLHDLGRFVVGGELSYSTSDLEDITDASVSSTRLKLIGGFDAGRVLPYAFIGVSDMKLDEGGDTASDTATAYGIGARFAFGAQGRLVAGVEYLVEKKDDFDGSAIDIDNREFALRLDYRF